MYINHHTANSISHMLLQFATQRLPVHHRKPNLQRQPVALIAHHRVLLRNVRHTHQTSRRRLFAHRTVWSHLFLQQLYYRLRRVIFQEQIEVGLVLVYQAAEGGYVDLPQVGIHDILDRQIENFLQQTNLIGLFLNKSILKGEVGQQNDDLIQQHLGLPIIVVLLHLLLAVANYWAASNQKWTNSLLALGLDHQSAQPAQSSLEAAVGDFKSEQHRCLYYCGIALGQSEAAGRWFCFFELYEKNEAKLC